MSVQVVYKNKAKTSDLGEIVLFSDEKFQINAFFNEIAINLEIVRALKIIFAHMVALVSLYEMHYTDMGQS